MMRYGHGFGFGMFGGIISWIFGIIILGLILFAVVKLFQNTGNRDENSRYSRVTGNNAMEILRERYAKGEISDEEYEQKKKMLEKDK